MLLQDKRDDDFGKVEADDSKESSDEDDGPKTLQGQTKDEEEEGGIQ